MRSHISLILFLAACGSSSSQETDTGDTIPTDTDDTGVVPPTDSDDDNDGFTEDEGDCNDVQPAINPSATDIVGDEIDQNCDGADGFDSDGDGHADLASGGDDCDDEDNFTFPGAIEIWYDGKAQGCEVGPDEEWADYDQDGDGIFVLGVGEDCVDTNPNINPEAPEVNGNGLDDNCSGTVDGLRATLTWNPTGTPALDFVVEDSEKTSTLYMMSVNLNVEEYDLLHADFESWLSLNPADTAFEDEFTTLTYILLTDGELNGLGADCVIWGPNVQTMRDEIGTVASTCVEADPTNW